MLRAIIASPAHAANSASPGEVERSRAARKQAPLVARQAWPKMSDDAVLGYDFAADPRWLEHLDELSLSDNSDAEDGGTLILLAKQNWYRQNVVGFSVATRRQVACFCRFSVVSSCVAWFNSTRCSSWLNPCRSILSLADLCELD